MIIESETNSLDFIPDVFKDDSIVRYTKPLLTSIESINGNVTIVIGEGESERKLDYITQITDFTPSNGSDARTLTFKANNFLNIPIVTLYVMVKPTVSKDKSHATFAFNIDMSSNLNFKDGKSWSPDTIRLMLSTGMPLEIDGAVLPYYIENGGLGDGTIIIHVFNDDDKRGLISWSNKVGDTLQNMMISLLDTINKSDDVNVVASYQYNLGSQFPVSMLSVLGNTIIRMESIGGGAADMSIQRARLGGFRYLDTILNVTSKVLAGVDPQGNESFIRDLEFMRKVVGDESNAVALASSILRITSLFTLFDRMARYQERNEDGEFVMSNDERAEVSDDVKRLAHKPNFSIALESAIDSKVESLLATLAEGATSPGLIEYVSSILTGDLQQLAKYIDLKQLRRT
jgi:hypothetical protein